MVYRFVCSVLKEYNVFFEYVLFLYLYLNGEIAQLARAHGSYPWCRGFESLSRYFSFFAEVLFIRFLLFSSLKDSIIITFPL